MTDSPSCFTYVTFGRIEYGVEILLRVKRGRIVTDSPLLPKILDKIL